MMMAIAAAGLALSGAGLAMNISAQNKQAAANQQAMAYQQEQDAEKKKAMELDATRRKREMIRQAVFARGRAVSLATNQGSAQSSALQGAYGGIAGRTGVNALGVDQNLSIGESLFGLKAGESYAKMQAAQYGSQAQIGAGISSMGGAIIHNLSQINSIGTTLGSWFNHPVDVGSATSYVNTPTQD